MQWLAVILHTEWLSALGCSPLIKALGPALNELMDDARKGRFGGLSVGVVSSTKHLILALEEFRNLGTLLVQDAKKHFYAGYARVSRHHLRTRLLESGEKHIFS